jgi:hypothetical protein
VAGVGVVDGGRRVGRAEVDAELVGQVSRPAVRMAPGRRPARARRLVAPWGQSERARQGALSSIRVA